MASKIFDGMNLADIARNGRERPNSAPPDKAGTPRAVLPAVELALTGRASPEMERENIFSVDPKRIRPWKHHNRTEAWYTRERCQDLIESIAKDEQQDPAVGRRLKGDPHFDYELIYGMRRRFACETLGKKLKLRLVDVDDEKAAVLMHIENADRQDITPMERALSFQALLEEKVFATQEDLASAMNVSKGQISKMLKAAALLRQGAIGSLFADKSAIPLDQAYKLAVLLERTGAKEIILMAAKNLGRDQARRGPADVLKSLVASLDRTKKFPPMHKQYNVGTSRRVAVTRNAKGKVTFAFAQGLDGLDKGEVLKAVEEILKDLG